MTQQPLPTVISRKAAHTQGLKRFYTGKPCNKGHVTERYVSTGGCIGCQALTYKHRQNPWTHELEPAHLQQLWVPRTYTPEHRQALELYLQRCVYEHAKALGLLTEGILIAANAQLEPHGLKM